MKFKNDKQWLAGIVAIAALGGLFVGQASADEKTIPATNCVQVSGLGTLLRDLNGRIFNTSSLADVTVLCPLVRDNVVSAPTSVRVVVFDNSSTLIGEDDILCRVRSMSPTGSQAFLGSVRSTSGTNSAGTTLTLTPVSEFDRGAYAVQCTIPRKGLIDPNSGIASITIDEP